MSAESPFAPGVAKPVPEPGASAVDFVIPNGRLGRTASPHAQGWEPRSMFVGIDVAKDRLDVHVRPADESFVVGRDGEGIEELAKRLNTMTPSLIVLEATGGFETVVAAGLAAAGPWRSSIRARSVTSPGPRLDWPRPIPWMPPSSLTSPRR